MPLAMTFHSLRSSVFLLISQVGTPSSVNASRSRLPASTKTAGGVQKDLTQLPLWDAYKTQPFNTVKLIEDPCPISVKEGYYIGIGSIDRLHLLTGKLPNPNRVVYTICEQHRLRKQGAEENRTQPIVVRFTGREG